MAKDPLFRCVFSVAKVLHACNYGVLSSALPLWYKCFVLPWWSCQSLEAPTTPTSAAIMLLRRGKSWPALPSIMWPAPHYVAQMQSKHLLAGEIPPLCQRHNEVDATQVGVAQCSVQHFHNAWNTQTTRFCSVHLPLPYCLKHTNTRDLAQTVETHKWWSKTHLLRV